MKKNKKTEKREIIRLENNILKVMTLFEDNQISEEIFPLKEVSEKQLYAYRKSRKPGMVVKEFDKYFYTPIPKNLKLLSQNILGEHCCGKPGVDCKKLYACEGGCQKVKDLSVEYYERLEYSKEQALFLSKRIEKYNFIQVGYETFNTKLDVFVVVDCMDYVEESANTRKRRPMGEINDLKISLAQYVWPEVSTRTEVQRRIAKNYLF